MDHTEGAPGTSGEADPHTTASPEHALEPAAGAPHVPPGLLCIECGYELTGLRPDANCPECGVPVERALRGNLLVHRSREYVTKLRRGLSLVLNGILLWICAAIAGIFLPVLGTPFSGWITVLASAVGLGISAMILLGYWLFTTRDPGDPVRDGAPTARSVLRVASITKAAADLLAFAFTTVILLFAGAGATPTPTGQPTAGVSLLLVLSLLNLILSLVSLAAFVTIFFAAMAYVRGMAHRLPNEKVFRQAKNRMIACPIWATVGILLIGLGPLIALILYWNLLDVVRKDLKRILNEQAANA